LTGLFLSRAGSLTVGQFDNSRLLPHVQLMKPAKVAPIASCPPPRLMSKDAGAGEARYGGVVDIADLPQCGAYTD